MPRPDEIVVKVSNLEFGGILNGRSGRDQTASLLQGADLALVQELWAGEDPGDEATALREFRELARLSGLDPVAIGQPRGEAMLRTGIMINPERFQVLAHGPKPSLETPYWTEATLQAPDGTVLNAYSVHAPASNAVGQWQEAQRLATRIAAHPGRAAIAAGDWNCYSPRDQPAPGQLLKLPRHLWPSRLRRIDGVLTVNLDVHEALELGGLADPVPFLPEDRCSPQQPRGTGSQPFGIIDRAYVPRWMVPAVLWHQQVPNDGSDHEMLWFGLDPAALVAAD